MARPTKLTTKLLKKAEEFLESCEDKEITLASGYDKDGEIRWDKKVVKLPSKERLAVILDVNTDTVYEWAKPFILTDEQKSDPEWRKKEEMRKRFSEILSRIDTVQCALLIENGSAGLYAQPVSARLLGKHGYKDESHQDLTSGGEKISIFETALKKLAKE